MDPTLTQSGYIANYGCNNGFVLFGDATRLCQDDGNLSGSLPLCLGKQRVMIDVDSYKSENKMLILTSTAFYTIFPAVTVCSSLESPANGSVSHPVNPTPGVIATYSCDQGYSLVGEENSTCLENRDWSGNEPTCKRED